MKEYKKGDQEYTDFVKSGLNVGFTDDQIDFLWSWFETPPVLETPTAKEGCCEEMLDSIEETLEQPTDAAYILGQLKVLVTHLRESLKFGHQTPKPKEEVLEMDGFMGRVKMPLYNPTWSHHTPPSNSEKEECYCNHRIAIGPVADNQELKDCTYSCHKEEVKEDTNNVWYCGKCLRTSCIDIGDCPFCEPPEGPIRVDDTYSDDDLKEPVKKPSQRIREIEDQLKRDQPNDMEDVMEYAVYCANMRSRAIIQYLNETQ